MTHTEPAVLVCAVVALIASLGVVRLRQERLRNFALLTCSVSVGCLALVAVSELLQPSPMGADLRRSVEPKNWLVSDQELGYRPLPNSKVRATARRGREQVYDVRYTIDANGWRTWRPLPASNSIAFIGDSFVFGEGVEDHETLPAAFQRASGLALAGLNFGVPGYGPNHSLRMLETGLVAAVHSAPPKAFVTWFIPDHLRRVTGDAEWLASSPKYTLMPDGRLSHRGPFNKAKADDMLAIHLPLLGALGARQKEELQSNLSVAILEEMARRIARDHAAPLIVIHTWPKTIPDPYHTMRRLLAIGVRTIDAEQIAMRASGRQTLIPHDGHPTPLLYELVARELLHVLEL